MKKSLFLNELKQILSNKKVLIPIIAVIFVPLLYAGMFLWSFWDPYDHLQDMPVAIVNEDTGANYENEKLELGNELVDKLKDNEEFNFSFVSKEKAYKDLKNQKYYLLVEIPKNFSSNATTLMDDKPQKLKLKYVPNESFNFLSSQIGETAVNEIKSAIAGEVTATYAETMFDKIDDVAVGLGKASDGAGELNDGANDLKDGSKALKDNLEELASKSIEFQDGVTKAHTGTAELAEGSRDLANGVGQLMEGSSGLLDASREVQAGSQQLADGSTDANQGLQELNKNVPTLVDGTNQVKDGLKQFQSVLPKQLANTINEKIQGSANEMNAGMDQLQVGLSQELSAGLAKQITEQQQAQTAQLIEGLKGQVPDEVLNEIVEQMKQNAPSKEALQKQLQPGINDGLAQGFSQYKTKVNKQLTGSTGGLESQIKAAVDPTFNKLQDGLASVNEGQKTLQTGVQQLAAGMKELNDGSIQLNQGQNEYVKNMSVFNQKITEANTGANKLASGANELNGGMNELTVGSEKISDGSHKLVDGSKALSDGTAELSDGSKELNEKLGEAADEAGAIESNDNTYDMMGDPVNVDKEEINKVPNYGTGFAPYFISLGLFVGALLITIVYKLNEPVIEPKNGFTWFMGKFGVIAVVGIIQAILVDAILIVGLGLEVTSLPLFILVSIITSITFMTLIQFLVTLFGDPGRFVAIVILIMQLTTSAGTFPLELIPNILRPINAALPMTYSVQAFKAVVSSGDYSFMWQNVAILATYAIVFMALTAIYFVVKHKRNQHNDVAHDKVSV